MASPNPLTSPAKPTTPTHNSPFPLEASPTSPPSPPTSPTSPPSSPTSPPSPRSPKHQEKYSEFRGVHSHKGVLGLDLTVCHTNPDSASNHEIGPTAFAICKLPPCSSALPTWVDLPKMRPFASVSYTPDEITLVTPIDWRSKKGLHFMATQGDKGYEVDWNCLPQPQRTHCRALLTPTPTPTPLLNPTTRSTGTGTHSKWRARSTLLLSGLSRISRAI